MKGLSLEEIPKYGDVKQHGHVFLFLSFYAGELRLLVLMKGTELFLQMEEGGSFHVA